MTIHLICLANGEEHEVSDTYVVEFDPSFMEPNEEYSGGLLRTTRDVTQARQFATSQEAFEYWRQSYGLRPDGQPNRPLTAFTVEIS